MRALMEPAERSLLILLGREIVTQLSNWENSARESSGG